MSDSVSGVVDNCKLLKITKDNTVKPPLFTQFGHNTTGSWQLAPVLHPALVFKCEQFKDFISGRWCLGSNFLVTIWGFSVHYIAS